MPSIECLEEASDNARNALGCSLAVPARNWCRARTRDRPETAGQTLWRRRESNSQPPPCKGGALPIELRPRVTGSASAPTRSTNQTSEPPDPGIHLRWRASRWLRPTARPQRRRPADGAGPGTRRHRPPRATTGSSSSAPSSESLRQTTRIDRIAEDSRGHQRPQTVGLGGLEPPTSSLSGKRSNRLSYRPSNTATTLLQTHVRGTGFGCLVPTAPRLSKLPHRGSPPKSPGSAGRGPHMDRRSDPAFLYAHQWEHRLTGQRSKLTQRSGRFTCSKPVDGRDRGHGRACSRWRQPSPQPWPCPDVPVRTTAAPAHLAHRPRKAVRRKHPRPRRVRPRNPAAQRPARRRPEQQPA